MAEGQLSSQESLPLSQETCQLLNTLVNSQLTANIFEDVTADIAFNIEGPYLNGVQNNIYLAPNNEEIANNFVPVQTHHPEAPVRLSCLPASENYEGRYYFQVSVQNIKGGPWIFSEDMDKLYVNSEIACPFNISTSGPVPDNAYIRATALFISPEHKQLTVERCLTHAQKEMEQKLPEARHLVRCESVTAHYEINPYTNHHSVVVPLDKPPVGQLFSCYLFKFMCKTSCSGGPNRRPFMIVFTLENGGEVIGRQKIDVKVCACPARDLKSDMKQLSANSTINESDSKSVTKTKSSNDSSIQIKKPNGQSKRPNLDIEDMKPVKLRKSEEDDQKVYNLKVHGRKCYEFLKTMKKYYGIHCAMKNNYPGFKCLIYSSSSEESSEPERKDC